MKIGWAGLGKLGLPCALVLAQHHEEVWGYDPSRLPWDMLAGQVTPMQEEGLLQLLASGNNLRRAGSIDELVRRSDIIFVAVQTPHAAAYGGELPMPADRRDFDYSCLTQTCRTICQAASRLQKRITLAVISTVLPGTMNRLIRPLLGSFVDLVYTPQFIAMGTTISDFQSPEFAICGTESTAAASALRDALAPVHGKDLLFECDVESAEAIKVLYNTFISTKIVFANLVMELSHKTGADCDVVVNALSLATDRVISSAYLRGGMGDGGACHPRDLIAMSWLAERLDLSYDLLGAVAMARESQTRWIAQLVREQHELTRLPICVLGKSYKPGSDLTYGSPALLLAHYLQDLKPIHLDAHIGDPSPSPSAPFVYVIATRHHEYAEARFTAGSVIIDPFGHIPDRDNVTVVRVGRKS